MTGIVTDTTGAVIADTVVTLSNASTGVTFKAKTDTKGSYRFANVPPNEGYLVVFTKAGFSTASVRSVSLGVGITRTQDATLGASATQETEVSATNAVATLNTTDASIGNNFDVKLINDLPIQNRDTPSSLFALQPGVAASSVTGARTDQTSVTLDGMDVNDIVAGSGLGGSIVADAPVDSVQEFRGVVAGLPASVGTGSGGQFQLVTKNGTNQFHGDLNEYHRDTSTVANGYFNKSAGLPRTPLIRNQFGGAVGGPILKDKLFFFFDFNNSRIIQSASQERLVPLDSFRAGTINYIYKNQNGIATNPACNFNSTLLTTPNCIGNYSSAQVAALDPQGVGFNPTLLAFINSRYPHVNDPNYSAADGINYGGYRFTQPTPDTLYNYVARLDYNLTSRQRIFVRGSIDREDSVYAANQLPTDPLTSPYQNRSYGYVVSHVWQIGNNKVNQFYYGDTIQKVSFPNLYNPTGTTQLGFGVISNPYASGSSQKRRIPVPEFRDDFNWQIGSHNIGFGGTFKFTKTNSQLVSDFNSVGVGLGGLTATLNPSLRPAAIRGGTTAAGLWDNAFAFALGRISGINSLYNFNAQGQAQPQGQGAKRAYRFYETEAYVGDTWKVSKQLTVNYGVRYQYYTVPYETHGAETIVNQSFDQIFNARVAAGNAGKEGDTVIPFLVYSLGGKANNAAPTYKPSYKDFAPRVSFAYNPSSLPKTVFNGSAALVYDRTVINAINFIQDQSSFLFQNNTGVTYGQANANAALKADPRLGPAASGSLSPFSLGTATIPVAPAITAPYTPYVSGGSPYGGPSGTGYASNIDPNLKDPYSIAFNAGVQQELPGHFLLKASYAGRLGKRLLAQADASQVVDFTNTTPGTQPTGQTLVQATANLTQQLRAGTPTTTQPFFENEVGKGATPFIVANFANLIQLGDIADFVNALEENGLINTNVGVGAQFALNPWYTNKGSSTYHGLLVTLSKNLSQGVQFDFNYTWSHSMDNVSANANYIAANTLVNFVCDAANLRKCRGNSDFDVQTVVNSNFIVALPVGRGRAFFSNPNVLVNELIGGWSVSGTPSWRSGLALGTVSNAFAAGFNEDAPAIFNGNRVAVQAHVHKTSTGSVQLFGDQAAAAAAFTGPIGLTVGSRNNLRGPSAFGMDAGLAKIFPVYREVNLKFRADFFNVLNHAAFSLPNTDFTSPSFGVISGTAIGARVGQFSLRLEF